MAKRVSVDADELRRFILSARSDNEVLISEHCISDREGDIQRDDFEKSVSRLDIKDV